jgi:hypothetical protein
MKVKIHASSNLSDHHAIREAQRKAKQAATELSHSIHLGNLKLGGRKKPARRFSASTEQAMEQFHYHDPEEMSEGMKELINTMHDGEY